MNYYKLVRPDLGSFYDAAFKWPLSGVVEVKNCTQNGPCGIGLHLARSVNDGLRYAKFPFRILKVRPLSPTLDEDDTKIRVAKAEIIEEIPVPAWARKIEKRIQEFPAEMKAIPWWKGTDEKAARRLIKSHFELLVPFGFKLDFDIEIVNERSSATAAREAAGAAARETAWEAAWEAAREAAWAAAWEAARAAAGAAAREAAREAAGAAAREAAWEAAWEAAEAAAWAAAWEAAWEAAREAAREAAEAAAWEAAWEAAREAAWAARAAEAAGAAAGGENPFKPLWECWKLGVWPIGFVKDKLIIYVAKGKS